MNESDTSLANNTGHFNLLTTQKLWSQKLWSFLQFNPRVFACRGTHLTIRRGVQGAESLRISFSRGSIAGLPLCCQSS